MTNVPPHKCAPPTGLWPTEAYPDESAVGFFRRLAKINHQDSAWVFGKWLGLNFRNPLPADVMEIVEQYPIKGLEFLWANRWERKGNIIHFRGEEFSHFAFSCSPRVCTDCLDEHHYYRSWFDVRLIDVCPIHAKRMVSEANGSKLSRYDVELNRTKSGHQVVSPEAPEGDHLWEEYILGRLGFANKVPVDVLDYASLNDVARLCGTIGRFLLGTAVKRGMGPVAPKASELKAGFNAVSGGPDKLTDKLTTVARSYINREKFFEDFHKLAYSFNNLKSASVRSHFRAISRDVSIRSGMSLPRGRLVRSAQSQDDLTIAQLASKHRLNRSTVRRALEEIGMLPESQGRGVALRIDPSAQRLLSDFLHS